MHTRAQCAGRGQGRAGRGGGPGVLPGGRARLADRRGLANSPSFPSLSLTRPARGGGRLRGGGGSGGSQQGEEGGEAHGVWPRPGLVSGAGTGGGVGGCEPLRSRSRSLSFFFFFCHFQFWRRRPGPRKKGITPPTRSRTTVTLLVSHPSGAAAGAVAPRGNPPPARHPLRAPRLSFTHLLSPFGPRPPLPSPARILDLAPGRLAPDCCDRRRARRRP